MSNVNELLDLAKIEIKKLNLGEIFLLVDNGECSYKIKQVEDSFEQRKTMGKNPAHIIIIDAKPKAPASNYKI